MSLPLRKYLISEKQMPFSEDHLWLSAPRGRQVTGDCHPPETRHSPGCPPRSAGSRPPWVPPSGRAGARWIPWGQRRTRSPEPHPEPGRRLAAEDWP